MAKINMKKIQDSLINRGLAGAAGGAVAQFVGDKLPASINPMFKNVGTILVGAIIPELSPKTKFLEGAGAGMAGVGGANLLKSMMSGTATRSSEVNGLEDEGWTETSPMNGLPMDDDDDMNGLGSDEFPVDDDDVNGVDDITQE